MSSLASAQIELDSITDRLPQLVDAYFGRLPLDRRLPVAALVREVYAQVGRGVSPEILPPHTVCAAARAMRQILVEYATRRKQARRSGDGALTLDGRDLGARGGVDVLVLDDALGRLSRWAPTQARIVELRFFVGLTVEEIAAILGLSETSARRDWALARAWLQRVLGPTEHLAD
ncbi:MAG TPA: ECF-type sigma factor [Vicinamibacterales bacterium]|nr:ECF-type sigma factor [Vicinamibacterales bacterium]